MPPYAGEEVSDSRGPGDPEMLLDIMAAIRRLDMDPDLEVGHAITRAAMSAVLPAPVRRDEAGNSSGAPSRGSLSSVEEKCGPALPAEMIETGLELWGKDLLLGGEEHFLDLRMPHDVRKMTVLPQDSPSPRLAAALSMALPGLGSLYAGSFRAGAAFFLMFLATGIGGGRLGHSAASGPSLLPIPTEYLALAAVVAVCVSCLVAIFSVAAAYEFASAVTPYAKPWLKRSVAGSAASSAMLPGWGQFLNDQPRKGAFFLSALPLLAAAVLVFGPVHPLADWSASALVFLPSELVRGAFAASGMAGGVLWILSVYDAALIASQHTRRRRRGN